MFFVEDKIVFNDSQRELIDEVTNNKASLFPFFLSKSTKNRKAFIHCLMARNVDNPKERGVVKANAYDFFHDIFINFCKSHNVKVKTILRAAVNYYIYYDQFVALPHDDHKFEHFNFLLYLTECKGGSTIIYDSDDNIIKSIPPEKFKAIIFPGQKHAIEEFEPGEDRIVVVFTFIKE